MKLFYDLRLGYLVSAPGIDTPLDDLVGKSGDGDEVILQFGRSSDPTGSISIIAAPTWEPENLAGGTVITVGLKEAGKYSDGDSLASNSTWTHDAVAFTYTGALNLNTVAINDALERDDADDENDIASLDCNFECTFQVGGSGPWRSSILQVSYTLHHDIISGSEGTPADADDPDEYLLKASGAEYFPTVTSRTGGTGADLDFVPTTTMTVGKVIFFCDTDPATDEIKHYRLEAGTDAESDPNVIRPDDYDGVTNAKVWKLLKVAGSAGVAGGTGGTDNAILRADGMGGNTIQASGITIPDGASGTLTNTNSGDVTLTASVSDVLSISTQAIRAVDPNADRILFWDDSAGKWRYLTVGSGLSISGTTITATGTAYAGAPSSTDTLNANTSFVSAHKGKMLIFDTYGGALDLELSSTGVSDGDYAWVMQGHASNDLSITRNSVSLFYADTDADIASAGSGKVYLIWYQGSSVYRILSIA